MKIVSAIDFGRETLSMSDSAESDARALLAHTLQADISYLLAHDDELISNQLLDVYFEFVARAEQYEPLPYIFGSAAFRYLDLYVTPAVLIPRPETEQLVDEVRKWSRGRSNLALVDVGTGSGCIAISLATEMKNARVSAVDISADALAIAQQNADENKADITFYQGSLLEPVDGLFDAIVANLPYITDDEMLDLPPSVNQYEPYIALHGGKDGLSLIHMLLEEAKAHLRPYGAIFLEIGYRQGPLATQLAQNIFPKATVSCLEDYAGHDRFIIIKMNQ
ncbi:MAG: peptide chain release factor N(5)-glutamine methyltransferase [Candidatus Promineifilaceae bacterium]